METLMKVRELLAAHLEMDVEEVKENAGFEELGIDSLDAVEIMMELEDEFGIEIAPNEAGKSVSELVKYIEAKKA